MRVLLLMACASVAHGASSIEKWAADLLRTEPWTMTYPPKWSPGGVVNLDADSFDPSINNGHPWMVMFHGPDASKVDEYYPYFNAWGKWASRQQHDLRFGAVECIWEHNDEGQATGAAKRNYQEICRLRMKIGYDMWPVFMVFLPDGTMFEFDPSHGMKDYQWAWSHLTHRSQFNAFLEGGYRTYPADQGRPVRPIPPPVSWLDVTLAPVFQQLTYLRNDVSTLVRSKGHGTAALVALCVMFGASVKNPVASLYNGGVAATVLASGTHLAPHVLGKIEQDWLETVDIYKNAAAVAVIASLLVGVRVADHVSATSRGQ